MKLAKKIKSDFLTTYAQYIPLYRSLVCKPGLHSDNNVFNIWQKYSAEKLDSYNLEIIQPMLDFIKEVICNNDDESYKYLMTWLYYLIDKPEEQTNIAIFLLSEQGTGKNTFTTFISLILGKHLYTEMKGFEEL